MPYLPGGTLKEQLKQGPLPWQQAVRLLIPIADALAYAHDQGIIHRDIKPANILTTQSGAPMLADFWVANFFDTEETSDLTSTGMGVGMPEYMAPEQLVGKKVDQRVDIYSLGVVFYEMVTGRKPFHADTPMEVLFKHANEPLPRPKQFVPNLPDSIEQILDRALAKKPQDRYQTMTEFGQALEELSIHAEKEHPATGTTLASRLGEGTRDVVATPRRNVAWRLWAAGIAGLILIALVVFGLSNNASEVFRRVPTKTPSPTTTLTSTITLTPTMTLTPTASSTPTITPTPTQMPISVENAANLEIISGISFPSGDFAFSPDGEIMASGMEDSSVGLWQVSDGVLLRTLATHPNPYYSAGKLAISPDGKVLACVYYNYANTDYTIWLWQIEDGSLLHKLEGHTNYVNSIAFSPDSQFLVSGGKDATVRLWRVADGALRGVMSHPNEVTAVTFSPNGQTLASSSMTGSVRLWRVTDGQLLFTLVGNPWVTSVAFSPDSQILASGHAGGYGAGVVRLWRVSDGTLLQTLEGHTDVVEAVAISPNGQIVASASRDGSVRLWKVSDGTILRVLGGPNDWLFSVAFISDGKFLAVGSWNGVKIYGLTP